MISKLVVGTNLIYKLEFNYVRCIRNIEKIRKKVEYERYSDNIREFINESGNIDCDYIRHQRIMANYFRGSINALMEVLK